MFHDGTEFQADAVKANFDRVTNKENALRRYSLYNNIAKTEVVDPYTARITLRKPFSAFINQLAHPAGVMICPKALAAYPFVKTVLPMDAFARCWIQEEMLFNAIGDALPQDQRSAYRTLQSVWRRSRQAAYASSVDAMARHIWHALAAHMPLETPSLRERAITVGQRFGFFKDEHNAVADAQAALASQAADSFCSLTARLIEINGLHGSGVSKEIFRRMKTDWDLAVYSMDPQSAAAIGTGIGAAFAAAGLAVDLSSAGLTLGLGTLVGGLIGAVSGIGAAHAYNLTRQKAGADLTWSSQAVSGFLLETILLYLAVAHFGRGRGDWEESESPEFWKKAVSDAIAKSNIPLNDIRKLAPNAGVNALLQPIDAILKRVFELLYPPE